MTNERRTPWHRVTLCAVVLVSVVACAGRGTAPAAFGDASENPVVTITVQNDDYSDATIYANWRGVRRRVGMVIGKTTETFVTPWRDYDVVLEVDFVGGGGMRAAAEFSVNPGDHLDFIIMPGW
jgi:hypothetical protein